MSVAHQKQWLLPLPTSNSTISIRRFTKPPILPIPSAESSADAIRRAALEEISANEYGDLLEQAWREINGQRADGTASASAEVLSSPCATIVAGGTKGRSGEENRRELWVFGTEGKSEGDDPEFLSVILDRLTPVKTGSYTSSFELEDLLSCDTHGHSLSCLSVGVAPRAPCAVHWRPEGNKRAWRLFTSAVVEKLAWRNGKRLEMQEGSMPLYALRPLAPSHLILTHRTDQYPDKAKVAPLPGNVVLLPTHTPALRVTPFEPTPAQLEYLHKSFSASLGPAWSNPLAEKSILRPHLNGSQTNWSIYWVRKPSADEANQGVLVIWPDNLTSYPTPSQPPKPKFRKTDIPTISSQPALEMMDIASDLFGFLSTYKEPSPPPQPSPSPDTQINNLSHVNVDLPTPQTGPGSTPQVAPEADSVDTGDPTQVDGDAMDEDDDLFSSNPTSPVPPNLSLANNEVGIPDELMPGNADDFDALFAEAGDDSERRPSPPGVELDKDFEMGSPEPAGREEDYEHYGVQDENEITADDFAFLDSPTGDEGEEPEEEKEVISWSMDAEAKGSEAHSAPIVKAAGDTTGHRSTENPSEIISQTPQGVSNPATTEHGDLAEINEDASSQPADLNEFDIPPIPKPFRDESKSLSSHKRKSTADPPHPLPPSPSSQFIPSLFAPLDIRRPNTIPLPNTFPTPAPTPESVAMRDDLIERLRQSKRQKGDDDYTSGWQIEDDISEVEEESEENEAPPTPSSENDSDEDVTSIAGTTSARGTDAGKESAKSIIEWRGVRCLGQEWTWVKDEERVWESIGRPWNPDWTISGLVVPVSASTLPSPPASPVIRPKTLGEIDLDRISREIVGNRYFRNTFSLPQITPSNSDYNFRPSPDFDAFASLLNILDPSETAPVSAKMLASCNVHAGFAGNVIRLSVAGIRYWQQLGLSPVGGEKKVEAMVITGPGDDQKASAEGFLRGMELVWGQYRLGKHTIAGDGIAQVALTDMRSKIGELSLKIATDDALILYLLLDLDNVYSPATFQALSRSLPENVTVHIVLTSAIQPRHLPDIAVDVYNRIPRLQYCLQPSLPHMPAPRSPMYFQYPSFTLAPDDAPKPALTLEWPLRSYDVLNRWRYVHAAYTFNSVSGLMVIFIIDSEGENFEVKTYRTKDVGMAERMGLVWKICLDFAEVAAIEWRMSITRVGQGMTKEELDIWRKIIGASFVTLLFVDSDVSPSSGDSTLSSNIPVPAPVFADPSARITDNTLTTRISTSAYRIPIPLSPAETDGEFETIYPILSFTLTANVSPTSGAEADTAIYHVISHQAAPAKDTEKVNEVLSRQFQRLICLGRLRFGLNETAVGVHVESVRTVGKILRDSGVAE